MTCAQLGQSAYQPWLEDRKPRPLTAGTAERKW